jgi:hypothetical protein
MRTFLWGAALGVAVVLGSGCSSSHAGTGSAADGAPGSGSTPTAAVATVVAEHFIGGQQGQVYATFERAENGVGCPSASSIGHCSLLNCPSSSPDLEAGVVTVVGLQTVAVSRQATGYYGHTAFSGPLWNPGKSITVDIGGSAGDPPHTTATVVGASPLTLIEPVGTAVTVTRNQDLTVTWQGGSGAFAVIGLFGGNPETVGVACASPLSVGAVAVPGPLLSMLPAGDYRLRVKVQTGANMPSGGTWSFDIIASSDSAELSATLQ